MAIDSKDPDGDSEMASSVDSVSDVPGNGARTPTHNPQATAAAASELSPPGSQPQQAPSITATNKPKGPELVTGNGLAKATDHVVAAWKGKRAKEDFQRAMDHVVDKDFNTNEFGDPFDERELNDPLL
ncbi:hypothetical protein N7513_000821 [Penicillium frequentans]|nr:hypothetical protein N7513_000821 [Penicillium glabrum]